MTKKINELADEFYMIFKQVEQIIPNLSDYKLKAKEPYWLPLQKGSATTIRDYILLTYASNYQLHELKENQDLLLTCALSFDIVSSAKHFDVDHFIPQSEIMEKLDHLVQEQEVLKKIKSKLLAILLQEQQNLGKQHKDAQSYANKIVDKLIPIDHQDHTLKVTGLRQIYYNCPSNLWPISGPVNRAKGKKGSIETAIHFVFNRIQNLLGIQHIRILAKRTALQFSVPFNEIKIKTKERQEKTVQLLSSTILKNFTDQCKQVDGENYRILPYIKESSKVISLLSFFQTTPIGEISRRFSTETAMVAKRTLSIARNIAFHAMATELVKDDLTLKKLGAANAGAIKVLKIFCKSLLEELNSNLKSSGLESGSEMVGGSTTSDDSSMDSSGMQIISNVGNTMMSAIAEVKRKRDRSALASDDHNVTNKAKHRKTKGKGLSFV